jgi:hypothetical protein
MGGKMAPAKIGRDGKIGEGARAPCGMKETRSDDVEPPWVRELNLEISDPVPNKNRNLPSLARSKVA